MAFLRSLMRMAISAPMAALLVALLVIYLRALPTGPIPTAIAMGTVLASSATVVGIVRDDPLLGLGGSLGLVTLAYGFMGNLHPLLLAGGLYGMIAILILHFPRIVQERRQA